MAKQTDILWEIEPHTQAKHEILRGYLGAWFGILGQRIPRIMYIDGFCGPGRYRGGEDGSPIIALKEAQKHASLIKNSHIVFFFIDEDAGRIEHLKSEIEPLKLPPNFELKIENGEFHQILQQFFEQAEKTNSRLIPSFAFIDPFGFKGVPFELVSRLLQNQSTEIFINVEINPVNRFIVTSKPKTQRHFIDLFGTPEAIEIARSSRDRLADLRRLYLAQLQKHARFVRYFEMRNERGRIIYYLFFASNHPLGHARMKEAFWKVDPSSGFRFSDATDPNQLVLFEADPSADLAKLIVFRFDSQTVTVMKIREYVENDTAYTASQMKTALRLLEEKNELCVSPCKSDGKKRRKDSFPDDVIVEF